jgi:hypothetical protein
VPADQEAGVGALGVQRVGRHDRPRQVKAFQQRPESRDLVAGGVHAALGEHDTVGVVQRGQQPDRSAILTGRATQRLAVDRDRAPASAGGWA